MFEHYDILKEWSAKKNFTRYMPQWLKDEVLNLPGETTMEKVAYGLGISPGKCVICGSKTAFRSLRRGYDTACSNKCHGEVQTQKSIDRNLDKASKFAGGKFEVHGHFMGSHHLELDVTNTECEHRFIVTAINLYKNENYCPECGNKDKYSQLTNRNLARQRPKEVIDSYNLYKNYVLTQTRRLYRQHQKKINPKNHPITRVDLHENAWNLDHIVPIIYCWENKIDADLCASLENLRVMKARANISKNKKMTKEAQAILASWGHC